MAGAATLAVLLGGMFRAFWRMLGRRCLTNRTSIWLVYLFHFVALIAWHSQYGCLIHHFQQYSRHANVEEPANWVQQALVLPSLSQQCRLWIIPWKVCSWPFRSFLLNSVAMSRTFGINLPNMLLKSGNDRSPPRLAGCSGAWIAWIVPVDTSKHSLQRAWPRKSMPLWKILTFLQNSVSRPRR